MITKIFKILAVVRAGVYMMVYRNISLPSYIGKPIFVMGLQNVKFGRYVRIFPGLRLESHNNGKIVIGDDVSIGQNFHITSSIDTLRIGAHTTILGNVFITNIDHDYQEIGIHILQQKYIVKRTEIGQNCYIGYGAAIQAGTVLGRQCIVGANSVVRGHFPDFSVIVGAPAKIVKRFNADTQTWDRVDANGEFI